MVVSLKSAAFEIKLTSEAAGWCKIYFTFQGKTQFLGADNAFVITEKLLSLFEYREVDGPFVGEIRGAQVKWLMSLAEGHTSFYVAPAHSTILLFVQDSAGSLTAEIEISDADCYSWANTLRQANKNFGA